MDQRQLGLDVNLPAFGDDVQRPWEKSHIKLFTEIRLKWRAQSFGIDVDDLTLECTKIAECRAMKRIVFIMNIFDEHFLEHFCRDADSKKKDTETQFIGIFVNCFSDYNDIALLDDLEHIRNHKSHLSSMDCQHGTNDGECIGEKMRHYRGNDRVDAKKGAFEEYMDELSLRERNLIKTASRIHSFICHENHCDEKEDVNQSNKRPMSEGRKEEMSNKFVNEIGSKKSTDLVEAKRMDDLPVRLQKNGLSDPQCAQFMNELLEQEYDSDAIVDDLVDDQNDPFNLCDDTNLLPLLQSNLFLVKTIKKHFGNSGNDDDQLPKFSFGKQRLYQWDHFKDAAGYVGSPQYDSLKEECLNNRIHRMTMRQFSEMLYSAYILRESAKGRTLKSRDIGGANQTHEVAVDLPLSVSYIFVLLMYCNLTDLQYKYKKIGCRERDSAQTLEEFKQWNREIWHWHRCIYEVVVFFGDLADPSKVFYTGLNTKLSFPSFAPVFNAPISTTVSIDIANGFCGDDGVILRVVPLVASIDSDKFFNVEWLSAFAHERERVFVRAADLRIVDIRYYARGNWQNNERYLRAFNMFSVLFSGGLISSMLRVKAKKREKPSQVLLDMIHVYKMNNNFAMTSSSSKPMVQIPIYIQQLFYQLLHHMRQKRKFLVKSEYDLLPPSLRNELAFFAADTASEFQSENGAKTAIQLSPFMQRFCGTEDIVLMYESVWVMDKEQIKKLRDAKEEDYVFSDMHYFQLSGGQRVSFQFAVYVNSENTEWGGLGMLIRDTPVVVDTRMSFFADELHMVWNNMVKGGCRNGHWTDGWIFKQHMLEKIDTLTIKFALNFCTQ